LKTKKGGAKEGKQRILQEHQARLLGKNAKIKRRIEGKKTDVTCTKPTITNALLLSKRRWGKECKVDDTTNQKRFNKQHTPSEC